MTALGGVSVRQADARYRVRASTAILWVCRARSGEVNARRQGQPEGSKLDAHKVFLSAMIDASSHISLHEMQAKLREERCVSAGMGTLWRFFHARAITVKKPPMPARETGSTSEPREKLGVTESLISIPSGWYPSMKLVSRPRWHVCTDAARGQRLQVGLPHGHWKTTTFVAGMRLSGFTAPMVLARLLVAPRSARSWKTAESGLLVGRLGGRPRCDPRLRRFAGCCSNSGHKRRCATCDVL